MSTGEGEKSQQQQQSWPTPSVPAFQMKPTQGGDDQLHDKNEHKVDQPQKKSMLRKVKGKAKTFIISMIMATTTTTKKKRTTITLSKKIRKRRKKK